MALKNQGGVLQLMNPTLVNLSQLAPLRRRHTGGDALKLGLQAHKIEVEFLLIHLPGNGRGLRNRFCFHSAVRIARRVGQIRSYPRQFS